MYYRFLRYPGGKPKAVTFSYDDAVRYDIQMLAIMNKYGIKCTLNVNNFVLDEQKRGSKLTPDEIREHIIDKGHELALHCATHKAPGRLSAIDGIHEVLDNRLALEKEFGMIIRGMAYPDCAMEPISEPNTYNRIQGYLGELGIVYARNCTGDNDRFALPDNWLNWLPTAHHNNPKIMEYIDKFLNIDVNSQYIASRTPKLFYMWGHSFEFECRKNWDHLENLCQKLSGHDDIWYATNIEIYDYVTAYNSLEYSADGTTVYNPTLFTIWFDIDKALYSIKPGETITIS